MGTSGIWKVYRYRFYLMEVQEVNLAQLMAGAVWGSKQNGSVGLEYRGVQRAPSLTH